MICRARSEQSATLYEHCVRAIEHGLRFGSHGLPLMGCGDWNDGMNLVGEQGKGESVWLAFFLVHVLQEFSEVARVRGDTAICREMRRPGRAIEREHRKQCLGRRVVSTRLLRQWRAAWLGQQSRMPDRFDSPKLVGLVRRGRSRASIGRPWRLSTTVLCAASTR